MSENISERSSIHSYDRSFSRFVVAVPKWVRLKSRTKGCFLIKKHFALPRHPRHYTPFSLPNLSLGPDVLDILS